MVMDSFDVRLLGALQADGRLTNQELAERVGLSASQCSRRRTALEEAGAIEGYHAVLSREAVGLGLVALVEVALAAHSAENSRRFRELLAELDEVQEAYAVTGEADYLLKVTVPDLKALSRLLNDVLLEHGSVARIHSRIVLERLKETTRLPLAEAR